MGEVNLYKEPFADLNHEFTEITIYREKISRI